MKPFFFLIFILVFFSSCTKAKKETKPVIQLNESEFVLDNSFKIGDTRRYGVFPNMIIGSHPKTKTNKMDVILDLAESGIPIVFEKGLYKTNLILKGRQHINMRFNDAQFTGQIQIIENENNNPSSYINLKGKLTTYNKFFTRHSSHITLDSLIVATDTLKNDFGKRSLGCSIYAGTKYLSAKYLRIEDLGSGDVYYTYSLAALQIHGWNNNPEHISLNEVLIEKSDRHGAYITGSNHKINNITIKKVGLGSLEFNNGLEDADVSEINAFTALWINKCKNSTIDKVSIDCKNSKALYTVNFDEGLSNEPTIINYLTIQNASNSIPMLPNDLTNIVVRHFKELNE